MSPTEKPVLVAGASGFVGSHIVRLLVQQGRTVRVLLRKSSSIAALEGLAVDVVDPRFWLTDQTPIYRNNVDGLENAMAAALDCGVERFVFTSTMGTLGLDPNGPVTEDIPFNWLDRAPPYIRARLEAENRFLACCREKALPGVALCVANTYGPEDFQPTPHNGNLWQVASGKLKVAVDVSQPTVDIRDVAEAALLAEARGKPGERYIIANEFVSNRDFYGLATAQTGQPAPRFIPYGIAYGVAWIAERYLKLRGRKDYLVSTDAMYLSNVFRAMDNGKARKELGWSPRPLAETVRDAVNWFATRQQAAL
jgi:dihydroflavonol-4-reductase